MPDSTPGDWGVQVNITGNVAGLEDSMDRASRSVRSMREHVGESLEEVSVVTERAANRIEHFGVSASFAMSSFAEGSERGVTRAAHAFANLGFVFGPLVGTITVALAIAGERMLEFFHKTEEAAKKAKEEIEKTTEAMRRAGEGEALLKQARLAQGDIDEATAKQRAAGVAYDEAKDKIKHLLDEGYAPMSRAVRNAKNEEIEKYEALKKTNEQLTVYSQNLKTITEATLNLRSAPATMHGASPVITEAQSPVAAAAAARKAWEEMLKDVQRYQNEMLAAIEHRWDATVKGEEKTGVKMTKAWAEIHQEWIKSNALVIEETEKGLDKIEKKNQKVLDEMKKAGEKWLADTEKGWMTVFGTVSRAVDQSVQGVVQGTLTMREAWANMFRSITLEALSAFIKMTEARAAHWLAAQGMDAAGTARAVALHAWEGLQFIAVEAAKAAAAAWAWASSKFDPFTAAAIGLGTLAAVLALGSGIGGGGGGGTGGGGASSQSSSASTPAAAPAPSHTIIMAMDAQSFHDWAMGNATTFAKATIAGASQGVRMPTTPGRGST